MIPIRPYAFGAALAATLFARAAANVPVVTTAVKPQKIAQSVSGGKRTYFVDFGPAYFGSVSFRLSNSGSADSAQIVISEAASATDVITNAVGARSSTAKIAVGAGSRDFAPFTDQPIRACRIRVTDGSMALDTAGIVLNAKHVPFDDSASSFASSDSMLDRVYRFCKHSIKATSYQGVYIDGIRETKPYEGDAYINMLSHFASDANPPIALFTHEYLLTHPTWPWEYRLISILIGWEIYMATGDQDQLRRNYQTLAGRIQSCIGSGSWTDSSALVDWPVAMRDGYDTLTRGGVVANAWAYKALMTIADMADALARPSEASAYRARAAQTKKRINDSLLVKSTGLYRDGMSSSHVSLHGNLYPLALGVAPDSLKRGIGKYLASRGMACNVYAAQFLLDGLFEAGFDSAAIALMAARTGNSWGHMMDQVGATITMEAWDPSQKPNLDWNHAWATAPANVIPRRLFGILPLTPGYATFQIKPRVGSLARGRYVLPTVKGALTVAFESRPGQSLKVTADIPAGAFAKVYLPAFAYPDDGIIVDGAGRTGTREGDFVYVDSIPGGQHVLSRGLPVAARPALPGFPAGTGVAIDAGSGTVRFRPGGAGAGTIFVTVRDIRGKRAGAFALAAGAERTLSLPPGLYICLAARAGERPVPAKFVVR